MDIPNAPLYINASLSLLLKEQEDSDYKYTICFHENSRDVLPEFAHMLREHKYGYGRTQEVFQQNRDTVRNGEKTIITTVDVFYLPYHYLFEKEHGSHTLLLTACEEEAVRIIDWYPPSFYIGEMSTEAFIKARGSVNPADQGVYSGDPIRNFWSEIENKDWNASPSALLNMTLDLTLKQQSEQPDRLQGTAAWTAISRWLVQIQKASPETRRDIIRYLYRELLPAFKRYLFLKQYMELYAQLTGADKAVFEPLIYALNQCVVKWDILHTLMMKYINTGTDSTYEKILKHLTEHLELDHMLKEKLTALRDILNA